MGVTILENRDASRKVFVRQSLPVPMGVINLRLAVEVFTRDDVQGEISRPWARLFLVGRDKGKKWLLHYPHQLKVSQRIEGWHLYSMVISIPPEAVELIAGMEIIQGKGITWISNEKRLQV